MAALDRLEIQIEAHANKANQSLELLVKKLDRISASLSGVNSRGLSTLGSGVNKLANAMANMNANTRTADFSRLANNLSKLNNVDTSKFHTIASAINALNTSLSRVGPISQSSVQISEIAKNLSKLGGANIQRAITNIPQLATAMRDLMQTLSTAPRVNENVIRLTNALASFASNGNRAGTAANNISNNLNAYHQTAVRSTKSTANLSVSLGKLYASAFLVIRVFKLLGKAIESSMDMTETVNYMNVVLKKMSSEWESAGYSSGESYTKALQSEMNELTGKLTGFVPDESGNLSAYNTASLGMNLNDVIKYQASFAQLASSMGLTAKSSTNLSKALTMLGADISSVKNMDLDVVFQKLASGLVGQSRAVRDLGGEITQVTLQEYAMKYGLTQSIQAMNQATKAQLRLLAMLDQLDFAFGDMASTINSAANSYRVFTNQAKNLSIILGNLFIPIISKVLPYINGLVIALQRLFTWIGGKLFGAGWLEDVNTSLGGASDGMGDLIGGTDDYEESLNDANAAAKKLKSAVSGIDELNINAPDESAGGGANKSTGGGGGIPELDTAISDALAEYEKIWNDAFDRMENKAQEFADSIQKFWADIYNRTEPLRQSLINLWNALKPFGKSFGKGFTEFLKDIGNLSIRIGNSALADFFNNLANSIDKISPETAEKLGYGFGILLSSLIGFKILNSVAGIILSLSSAFEILSSLNIVKLFAPISAMFAEGGIFGVGGAIATASAPFLILIAAIAALAVGLGVVFATNEDVRNSFNESIKSIGDNFKPIIEYLANKVLPDLKAGWQNIIKILKPFADFLNNVFVDIWQKMINPMLLYVGETLIPILINTFKNLWENILLPLGNFLSSVFSLIIDNLSTFLTILWKNVIVPLADFIGSTLSKVFESIYEILNKTVIPIVNKFIEVLQFLWVNVLTPVVNFLKDLFMPVFESVFESVGDIINGLKKVFGGLIDFVTGVFTGNWEKAWNGVKDIFSGIWDTLSAVMKTPINAVLSIFEGLANKVIDAWNWIKQGINGINIDIPEWLGGGKIGFDLAMSGHISIPKFEAGGFPEDGLFFANHNELVGQFAGGRTAVANNDMITAGIEEAAYRGFARAYAENNREASLLEELIEAVKEGKTIEIDGRELVSSVNARSARNGFSFT